LIARRGRTVFTPSNIGEVRRRFERILARVSEQFKAQFPAEVDGAEVNDWDSDPPERHQVDADLPRADLDRPPLVRTAPAVGSHAPRRSRTARMSLAERYLELRARLLAEDERRRPPAGRGNGASGTQAHAAQRVDGNTSNT
jgi:hypothetical protein